MVQEYISAFQRCYPQAQVDVKNAYNKEGRHIGYRVGINGDYGNLVLSADDIREATRAFKR